MYMRVGKSGRTYWGKSGAGVLFTDGVSVLLIRRSHNAADQKGKWCIPGGKTEEGESPVDTARRECVEEVGYYGGQIVSQHRELDGRHTFTVFINKVDRPFTPDLEDGEHDAWGWFRIEHVPKLELHDQFKKTFPFYRKQILTKFPKTYRNWLANHDEEE